LPLWGKHHLILPVCDLVLADYNLLLWLILLSLIEELTAWVPYPLLWLEYLNFYGSVLGIDMFNFNVNVFEFFIFFIDKVGTINGLHQLLLLFFHGGVTFEALRWGLGL
jgi:hypothetical protein